MSSNDLKLEEIKMQYINGQPWAHVFLKGGKFEGMRKVWHINGMLKSHGFYRDGKFEGLHEEWYDNGHPLMRIFHRDHKMEGEYKRWRGDGYIWEYQFCRNGKEVDEHFTLNKKLLFLRVKQSLRNRTAYLPITMLILDLAQYVILPPK